MVFCTLSNERYLLQGLALVDSIERYSSDDYKLYYLCLDDYTYEKILKISVTSLYKIIPISYSDLDSRYPQILHFKHTNYSEYCFSFSSLLPKYIFEKYNEPNIIYVDSDTLFYNDPHFIHYEVNGRDIGIVRHRFNDRTHESGEYNANVIYINNNENGNKLLDWWHIAYMTKNPTRLSSCGDQKFMEAFEDVLGHENVCVMDNIGHGAPWNFNLYRYDKFHETPKKIDWDGKEQIFLFNHFSQFVYDFDINAFSYSGNSHLMYTFNNMIFQHEPKLNQMYVEYYELLKFLNEEYDLNIRKKS